MPREGHDKRQQKEKEQKVDFNPRAPRGARPKGFVVVSPASWISIHVPREGHDTTAIRYPRWVATFQSTCPARGTTIRVSPTTRQTRNFNPRAPRGARRKINILLFKQAGNFNPRAPRGARLSINIGLSVRTAISIHVPREGHDQITPVKSLSAMNFNPRAPRGARPIVE